MENCSLKAFKTRIFLFFKKTFMYTSVNIMILAICNK